MVRNGGNKDVEYRVTTDITLDIFVKAENPVVASERVLAQTRELMDGLGYPVEFVEMVVSSVAERKEVL